MIDDDTTSPQATSPPPGWQAMLSALLVHGSKVGFLDEEDDALDPKRPRRRLRVGKPTKLTVGLMVGGHRITAVRCTDGKVRLPVAELARLIGVELDLARVGALPQLLGEIELKLLLGTLLMHPGLTGVGKLLNGLLAELLGTEKLLRMGKARPWIALAKHEPVYLRRDSYGAYPTLGRCPEIEDALAKLGLPPASTVEEARARYRELAKQHHPDLHGGGDDGRMKELNEAYARVSRLVDLLG